MVLNITNPPPLLANMTYNDTSPANASSQYAAQTSGTVCQNMTNNTSFFSRVYQLCSKIGHRSQFNVINRDFPMVDRDVDYIDFIQITKIESEVIVTVSYSAKDVYVFKPQQICFDMDGGFSFSSKKTIWHVVCMPSENICFDEQFILTIRNAKCGAIVFSTQFSSWVETAVTGGTRWINPSSKSILMPCDGRGGGLSRSLLKRWKRFDKHVFNSHVRRLFLRRLVKQDKKEQTSSFGNASFYSAFEPQMYDVPDIPRKMIYNGKCSHCDAPKGVVAVFKHGNVCHRCCPVVRFCWVCGDNPSHLCDDSVSGLQGIMLCKDCAIGFCPVCAQAAQDFWGAYQPQMFGSFANAFTDAPHKLGDIISGINDVTKAVHSAAVNGVGASNEVYARLDLLTGELGRFNDHVDGIRSEGLEMKHKLSLDPSDILKWCYEHKETIGIVVLISIIFILSSRVRHNALVVALGSLVSAFVFKYAPDLKSVWDRFSPNLLKPVCVFEAQMFDNPVLKSALLLSYIFGFRGLCVETLTNRFDKFCSVLSEAPRRTSDITSTIGFYLNSLQDLFNQTIAWCGFDYAISLAPDKYPVSTALLNDISNFLRTSASSKDLAVEQAARVSQVLQARLTDMLVKHKSDHEFSGDRLLLIRAQSKLESYDRELELRGAGRDVTRVPPKAYLFIGQPKIGKSYLLKSLSYMALYTLLKDNEVALQHIRNGQLRDYIFTRNSCDKFWEGYYNQMLVLLDEVGMQRDSPTSDAETNEYSNFIKMVNDVVFPLLMANVEKKGTREFNSSVIFGTTNSFHFQIESITNKSAYDRRWNTFEVTVKKEYAKWNYGHGGPADWLVPDFDKMKELGMSEQDIALSRFLEFRPRTSILAEGYKGPAISIDQLIDQIKNDISNRTDEVKSRQNQSDLLHAYFDPANKAAVPGGFEPQMDDCRCLVCKKSSGRFLTIEDTFWFSEEVKDINRNQFQAVFENGFDAVESENSYLYSSEPKCFRRLRESHPSWCSVQLLFQHGCDIKSFFLRELDLTDRRSKIDRIKSIALKAVSALGVLASLFSVWKIGRMLFADASEETVDHIPQYVDLNSQEVLNCILKRNVYAIGDDNVSFRGFVTFISDNILLIPYHYITAWQRDLERDPDFHLTLRRLGDKTNHQEIRFHVKYMLSEYTQLNNEDLVAVYLGGRVVQRHASLRKYLVNKISQKGEVLFPEVSRKDLAYSLVTAPYQVTNPLKYERGGYTYRVHNPIQYRYKTVVGDCGLPVGVKDPFNRCEKICGIHVTGAPSVGVGCSVPFTQETFDNVIEYFEQRHNLVQTQYRTDAGLLQDMQENNKSWNDLFSVPEDLEIPGKVNLGYAQPAPVPVKTSIIPSPLFKKVGFKPLTKPARLRPFTNSDGDFIDPNRLTTLKYHRTVAAFDLDVLDICKNDVSNMMVNGNMLRHHPDVKREPLTFDVAVAGLAGVEGMDGIPRRTSAGYPLCLTVDKRGKRDFFGECGDYDLDCAGAEEMRRQVHVIIDGAKRGIRYFHLFFDFPKDERRPVNKVDAGKTRKISCCPLTLSIPVRMHFGPFIQDFMFNRIFNQSALGVNVFDVTWDLIAQYLGEDCRIIAGDFGNYDGSLPYCLMIRFLDTVTDWYGDKGSDNERIREVLFQELVNSRHIMDGVIYEWVGSNASGNPLTTVLNSWCNLVLLRYATLKVVGKCNSREASKFLSSMDPTIRFMVYGDDNLISIKRDSQYVDVLTQDNYTKAFEEMGFEYTDESKSGVAIDQDRSIEDVSFLKRKWARTSLDSRRRFLSPLAIETIMESIQWTKRKDYTLDHVRENSVNMLQELSQHPRPIFDEWAPRIIGACKSEMGFTPIPNTYEECQAMVRSRDSF